MKIKQGILNLMRLKDNYNWADILKQEQNWTLRNEEKLRDNSN